jgi:hypothetical protein
MSVAYDAATNTARFRFPGYPGGLPDGGYRVTIAAADVTDIAGNPLAAGQTFDFFAFAGDANHDRTVDVQDLLIMGQNYNATGRTFAEGDFNYDGVVDVQDLLLLGQRYNTTLPDAGAPAPAPALAMSTEAESAPVSAVSTTSTVAVNAVPTSGPAANAARPLRSAVVTPVRNKPVATAQPVGPKKTAKPTPPVPPSRPSRESAPASPVSVTPPVRALPFGKRRIAREAVGD